MVGVSAAHQISPNGAKLIEKKLRPSEGPLLKQRDCYGQPKAQLKKQ